MSVTMYTYCICPLLYWLLSVVSSKIAERQERMVVRRADPGTRLPVFALALDNLVNLFNLFVPQASLL